MLLTCALSSIADLLRPSEGSPPRLTLGDVPAYVRDELGLNGLTMAADLLAGATRQDLATFRDRADKARCACLMLLEPAPLDLAVTSEDDAEKHLDRAARIIEAAHLLGCNAAGMRVSGPDTDEALELAVERLRWVSGKAEKLELNVLVNPQPGLTESPDRLSELIKRVGGFRIGSLPDFHAAAASEDPALYLKRITPYSSVVLASTEDFGDAPDSGPDDDTPGSLEALADMLMSTDAAPHTTFDLEPLVAAVAAVGFDGTLAIDYRGDEDGTVGVLKSRDALEAAIEGLAEK
ncbi:MAG: TIM barrel protein [Planctomycetota bacterium]